jgi:hypothetical protein
VVLTSHLPPVCKSWRKLALLSEISQFWNTKYAARCHCVLCFPWLVFDEKKSPNNQLFMLRPSVWNSKLCFKVKLIKNGAENSAIIPDWAQPSGQRKSATHVLRNHAHRGSLIYTEDAREGERFSYPCVAQHVKLQISLTHRGRDCYSGSVKFWLLAPPDWQTPTPIGLTFIEPGKKAVFCILKILLVEF